MIIGLYGLSGSGKTTIRKKFHSLHSDFFCTSASELLESRYRPIAYEELSDKVISKNQRILLNEYNYILHQYKNIFIELHALVEFSINSFYLVNDSVLKAFNLDLVFLLDTPIEKICTYRKIDYKNRSLASIETLRNYKKIQFNHLYSIYGNKLIIVNSIDDINKIYEINKDIYF